MALIIKNEKLSYKFTSTEEDGGGVFLLTAGIFSLFGSCRGERVGLLSSIFLFKDFFAGGVGGTGGLGRSDSTCLRLDNGECSSALVTASVLDTVGLLDCSALSLSVNFMSGLPSFFDGECLKTSMASFSLSANATDARLWDAARIAPGSIFKKIFQFITTI